MIGQSISTIAFDMDLIIKIHTIILCCISYMIREWNIASYGELLDCSASKILNNT